MMQPVRCVVVGDKGVGKTTLLISHTTNAFAGEYLPMQLEPATANMMVDGKLVCQSVVDTPAPGEENSQFRPLTYPGTDVVLICFTINRRESFNNVRELWVPEHVPTEIFTQIQYHLPDVPYIIVGTRIDIRAHTSGTPEGLESFQNQDLGPDPVTPEEGKNMAAALGAIKYLECSALTTVGQKLLFDEVVRVALDPKLKSKRGPPPPLPPKPHSPIVSPLPFTEARFASLVNKKEFSDVTFRVQDKELFAHKVILSASSPLFQKIFVNGSTDLPAMLTIMKTDLAEQINETENSDWRRIEQVTIQVNMLTYEALLAVLTSCYTGYSPADFAANSSTLPQEFSAESIEEAMTFFQRYPRFTSDERKNILLELAEDSDTKNNNNNNATAPSLVDVCIELPSKKREYCHKVLLAAECDYFSKLLANTEANDIVQVKVGLSDVEFSSIKRFLYTGTVNFNDKSFEYSKVVLPKLVKMNLIEYLSHCACHLRDSVRDSDKHDAHGYVLSILTLAEEFELRQLRAYCIWWMQVNFDTISEQEWFKNDMTLGNREEVERGQWPGNEYHKLYAEWKAGKSKKGKKDRNCLLQ